MQSHEERADGMLRAMGGSLDVSMQRNVLRRLILAEDQVQAATREVEQSTRRWTTLTSTRQADKAEIERLRQALSDIQFDLINCHQAAGRDACEHIKDAIKIVNRTLQQADSRSLNENCRCGRPLISPGDADPWCQGCNMSASTCDCVAVEV